MANSTVVLNEKSDDRLVNRLDLFRKHHEKCTQQYQQSLPAVILQNHEKSQQLFNKWGESKSKKHSKRTAARDILDAPKLKARKKQAISSNELDQKPFVPDLENDVVKNGRIDSLIGDPYNFSSELDHPIFDKTSLNESVSKGKISIGHTNATMSYSNREFTSSESAMMNSSNTHLMGSADISNFMQRRQPNSPNAMHNHFPGEQFSKMERATALSLNLDHSVSIAVTETQLERNNTSGSATQKQSFDGGIDGGADLSLNENFDEILNNMMNMDDDEMMRIASDGCSNNVFNDDDFDSVNMKTLKCEAQDVSVTANSIESNAKSTVQSGMLSEGNDICVQPVSSAATPHNVVEVVNNVTQVVHATNSIRFDQKLFSPNSADNTHSISVNNAKIGTIDSVELRNSNVCDFNDRLTASVLENAAPRGSHFYPQQPNELFYGSTRPSSMKPSVTSCGNFNVACDPPNMLLEEPKVVYSMPTVSNYDSSYQNTGSVRPQLATYPSSISMQQHNPSASVATARSLGQFANQGALWRNDERANFVQQSQQTSFLTHEQQSVSGFSNMNMMHTKHGYMPLRMQPADVNGPTSYPPSVTIAPYPEDTTAYENSGIAAGVASCHMPTEGVMVQAPGAIMQSTNATALPIEVPSSHMRTHMQPMQASYQPMQSNHAAMASYNAHAPVAAQLTGVRQQVFKAQLQQGYAPMDARHELAAQAQVSQPVMAPSRQWMGQMGLNQNVVRAQLAPAALAQRRAAVNPANMDYFGHMTNTGAAAGMPQAHQTMTADARLTGMPMAYMADRPQAQAMQPAMGTLTVNGELPYRMAQGQAPVMPVGMAAQRQMGFQSDVYFAQQVADQSRFQHSYEDASHHNYMPYAQQRAARY